MAAEEFLEKRSSTENKDIIIPDELFGGFLFYFLGNHLLLAAKAGTNMLDLRCYNFLPRDT